MSTLSVKAGDAFSLPISLENSNTDYVAFQMDIQVPQGVKPVFDEDGFIVIDKTSRLNSAHDFSATFDAESNTIKLLCSSMRNVKIKETSGELFFINLQADATMISGDYQVSCKNIMFSTSSAAEGGAQTYYMPDVSTVISVAGSAPVVTDINVSQALDIISKLEEGAYTKEYYLIHGVVSSISQISTSYGNMSFYMKAPNGNDLMVYRAYGLNGEKVTDGNLIQIGDEVVVYAQLQNYRGTPETRQGGYLTSIVKADHIVVPPVSADAGSTFSLPVCLENSNTDYVAFQMDIQVPQGVTPIVDEEGYVIIDKASRLYKSHDVSGTFDAWSNTIKLLGSSMSNAKIKETSGELFFINLQADATMISGDYQIACKNIMFSTSSTAEGGAQTYYMPDAFSTLSVKADENIVWTIAGSSEAVFGTAWDTSNTSNDMTMLEEGVFVLEKKNIKLMAGEEIQYKVVGNHSWDINYGQDGIADGPNVIFYVERAGIYNLYFYFYRKSGNWLACSYEYASSGIEPNPTEVVVYGQERDDLSDTDNGDGSITIREEEGGTGEEWDNQFWIVANRALHAGEEVIIEFDYMASGYASTKNEFHAEPSEFLYWNPLGNIWFTTEWNHFNALFTVPEDAEGMKSIAFDMAVAKEACDYHIKNVVWRLADDSESLINKEGSENFYIRIGADTEPFMYDDSAKGMFALLTTQILAAEAAIANLTYPKVPGASDLASSIEEAKTVTEDSEVAIIISTFKNLRNLTMSVQNLDDQCKELAGLMNRIELVIQKNTEADPALVEEVTNNIQETRLALQNGSYGEQDIYRMIDLMGRYYNELSKVYLTINLTQSGTLASLIQASGFDPMAIIGLTITGEQLYWEDVDYMRSYMRNLEMLNLRDANISEIYSWWFCGPNNLKKVVLPNNLQRIGEYAFGYAENLKSITCNSMIPPIVDNYVMAEYLDSQCTLYVPSIAVNAYQSAAYWNNFKIVGTDAMPENIFVGSNLTIDWPANLASDYKPNVSIGLGNISESYGALTLNGESIMSMNNFGMVWAPSNYYTHNNSETGSYEFYRYSNTSLIANTPMRADNVLVELRTNTFRWDFISFPFDVKVSDITNLLQSNAPLVIRRYDGEKRANYQMSETWVDMDAESTLEAGKGYIWQSADGDQEYSYNHFIVPALNNSNKNNIFKSDNATVELNEYISEYSQNRSWNLIGNPYPAFYDIRGMQTTAPITIWNGYNWVYEAYTPGDDNYILNPGQAFFIQRPVDQESITFLKEYRQNNLNVREDVGRRAAANSERYVFNLLLSGSEENLGDRTRIVFDATAKMDYEAGRDASKFMSPEASAAQLFTTVGGLRYAINNRPLSDGIVELGLSIGTAGSYTIALNTKVEGEVYLIDRETGSEIRLDGTEGYTFQATKGIIEGRFAVRFGNGDVTGIKGVAGDGKDAGNWYNLNGQRINAPAKGIFIQNGKKTVVK